MITFLTGTITENIWNNEGIITDMYGFQSTLRNHWKKDSRCLYVCSDPADYAGNDGAFLYYRDSFFRSGFRFSAFDLVDYRYIQDFSEERLSSYDVFILGSGRVPTQHGFFEELHLREFFQNNDVRDSDRIVIGISAGALNSADVTYNWPEEEGDSLVSKDQRFYQGLGLASVQVLPHFQARYDMYVDGRHLYNDITLSDSIGHEFLAIPDYSYVVCSLGREEVYGPYSYYKDGYFYDGSQVQRIAA